MCSTRNRVHITVFSRSELAPGERNSLEVMIRCGLGAGEDLAGFYRFAQKDPVLSVTVRDLRGMRNGLVDDVFGAAVLAILLQMAPMTRSDQMMGAFLEQYGNRIEFDKTVVNLWPRPDDIAGVNPDELRRAANLGYRAKWIVRAAQYLSGHPISLLELSTLPAEESTRQLMEIPGIGKYSAGIILGQATLPIDAWSVVIMSELFLGHTPAHPRGEIDQVISELTARWGRWSWLAFVYVLNDLENLANLYSLSRIS
jgi:DNA-3-methyladenine glycosylase II